MTRCRICGSPVMANGECYMCERRSVCDDIDFESLYEAEHARVMDLEQQNESLMDLLNQTKEDLAVAIRDLFRLRESNKPYDHMRSY